jgi:hypothetical protein
MDGGGLLDCHTCGLPVGIVDRFVLGRSPHPVEHVKILCVHGHWLTVPTDTVTANSLFRRGLTLR